MMKLAELVLVGLSISYHISYAPKGSSSLDGRGMEDPTVCIHDFPCLLSETQHSRASFEVRGCATNSHFINGGHIYEDETYPVLIIPVGRPAENVRGMLPGAWQVFGGGRGRVVAIQEQPADLLRDASGLSAPTPSKGQYVLHRACPCCVREDGWPASTCTTQMAQMGACFHTGTGN